MEERLTKKELKEQRKLEHLKQMEQSQKSSSSKTKGIVIGLIAVLFLAFFAWAVIFSKQNKPSSAEAIVLSSSGQRAGTESAKVTLVEFGDFQCPACKSYESALKQVRAEYKDEVQFIYKHFPLAIHKNAMPAGVAAEAAGRQGKFWEYHDVLYEKQGEWAPLLSPSEKFEAYATSLKLDIDQFRKDMTDKEIENDIRSQMDEGGKVGVNATPTFFLDGKYLNVNATFDSFKKAIDQALQK